RLSDVRDDVGLVRFTPRKAERISKPVSINGSSLARIRSEERIVRGDRAVRIDAQDLAPQGVWQLRLVVKRAPVTDRYVQLAVEPEMNVAAIVVAGIRRNRVQQDPFPGADAVDGRETRYAILR